MIAVLGTVLGDIFVGSCDSEFLVRVDHSFRLISPGIPISSSTYICPGKGLFQHLPKRCRWFVSLFPAGDRGPPLVEEWNAAARPISCSVVTIKIEDIKVYVPLSHPKILFPSLLLLISHSAPSVFRAIFRLRSSWAGRCELMEGISEPLVGRQQTSA